MTGFAPVNLSVASKAPGQWLHGQARDSCGGFFAETAGPVADLRLGWGADHGAKIPALAESPD